jgi:hypothetical protein
MNRFDYFSRSSIQTTALFLRAIKFYWENKDNRLTPEQRKEYIKTKLRQVVEHANRCQKESEEAAEKLESMHTHTHTHTHTIIDNHTNIFFMIQFFP